MADRTLGQALDGYISAGFSSGEIRDSFQKSHGIDVDKLDPSTPMWKLDTLGKAAHVANSSVAALSKAAPAAPPAPEPKAVEPFTDEQRQQLQSNTIKDTAPVGAPLPEAISRDYVSKHGGGFTMRDVAKEGIRTLKEDLPGKAVDVAGNLLGMASSGQFKLDAHRRLMDSDRAKAYKAAGKKTIDIHTPGSLVAMEHPVDRVILAKDVEDDLRAQVADLPTVAGAAHEQEAALKRARGKSNLANVERDAGDLQAGTWQMMNTLAQTGPEVPKNQGFAAAVDRGIHSGAGLAAGAVGGGAQLTASLLEDPLGTIQKVPLTALTMAVPELGAIRKLGKAGAATELGLRANKAITPTRVAQLFTKLEKSPASAALANALHAAPAGALLGGDAGSAALGAGVAAVLPGLTKFLGFKFPEEMAAFKRWLGDRTAQGTRTAQEVVQDILEQPQRVKSEVQNYAAESAGRVRHGVDVEVNQEPVQTFPGTNAPIPTGTIDNVDIARDGTVRRPTEQAEARTRMVDEADATKENFDRAHVPHDIQMDIHRGGLQGEHDAAEAALQEAQGRKALLKREKPNPKDAEELARLDDRVRAAQQVMSTSIANTGPEASAAEYAKMQASIAQSGPTGVQPRAALGEAPRSKLAPELAGLPQTRPPMPEFPEATPLPLTPAEAMAEHETASFARDIHRNRMDNRREFLDQKWGRDNTALDAQIRDHEMALREAKNNLERHDILAERQARYKQDMYDNLDEQGRLPGGDPEARDRAAGIKGRSYESLPTITVLDEGFKGVIRRTHQALADAGLTEEGPTGPMPITETEVSRQMTQALQNRSVQLLKSPQIRAEVIKGLVKDLGIETPNKARLKGLDAYLTDLANGPDVDARINGDILARDAIEKAMGRLARSPGVLEQARAEAMQQIGNDMAGHAYEHKLKGLVDAQKNKYDVVENQDPVAHKMEIAKAVAYGEDPPAILPKGITKAEFGQYLNTNEDVLAHVGTDVGAAKRLHDFAKRLDRDYVDSRIPGLEGHLVRRGFESSVGSSIKAAQNLGDMGSMINQVNAHLKGAVTSRNLPSNLNNLGGNTILDTIRLGLSPVEVWRDCGGALLAWKDYLGGAVKSPAELRMLRGIAKTAVVDSGMVDMELGALHSKGLPGKAIDASLGKLNRALDQGYKLGDVGFKLADTIRNYHKIMGDLESLQEGKSIVLDMDQGRTATILHKGNGIYEIEAPWKMGGKSISLEGEALADVVAQAAQKAGRDIFFDYSRVPLFNHALRQAPLAGVASPFYSWAWMAMDIPGFKKGLVSHLLDHDGAGLYTTNDPSLLARNAGRSMAVAARRTAAIGAVLSNRNAASELNSLMPALQFDPDDPSVGSIVPDKDGTVQYKDWGGNNLFAQSILALRLGTKALQSVFGQMPDTRESLEALKKTNPQAFAEKIVARELWARNESGGMFDGKDALTLAGMGGGMLMRLVTDKINNPKVSPTDLGREVIRMVLGGTPASLVNVGVGEFPEGGVATPWGHYGLQEGAKYGAHGMSLLTSHGHDVYDFPAGARPLATDDLAWVVRTLASVGAKRADLGGKLTQHLDGMEKRITDSIMKEEATIFQRRISNQIAHPGVPVDLRSPEHADFLTRLVKTVASTIADMKLQALKKLPKTPKTPGGG